MKNRSFKKNLSFLLLLFLIQLNAQVSYQDAFPNISFNFPVEIQASNDNTNRLFVVEQPGIIKVFPNSSTVTTSQVATFLDISSTVTYSFGQEIGLLGLALHPNYATNGYAFVYYIDRPSNYRINIARYQVDATNPNRLNPSSATLIAQFNKNQVDSNHNGGKIAFGPDGYLYISIGDGGGSGDPQGNGQNLNTVFGSLLRIDIDVDGSNPLESNPAAPNGNYEIPSDNPRVGQTGLDELYAWGIRNTWKFSFDPSGNLWGADVGQNAYEEINLITRGGNYGWNKFEANTEPSYGRGTTLATTPDIKPIFNYNHNAGDRSVTGGYVYRGSLTNSNLQNRYIYGDYITGRVWALSYNPTTGATNNTLLFKTSGQFVSSFGEDEQGELYFSDYGNAVKIYKLNEQVSGPVTTAVNGIGEWATIPNGTNGMVETVVEAADGVVYIGGDFSSVGGQPALNIAQRDSNDNWSSLSSGSNGTIYSLALAQDGTLYAGGDFSQIGGVNANNIAFWNGSTWSAMGSGTNGPVAKIKFDNTGTLILGGVFSSVNGITVNNIAQWQNGTFSALTDATTGSTGLNNEVRAIAFDENNNLYVGGNFDTAGGVPAARIARWDGANWSALAQGTSGFVQAITVTDNYIYAGGNFAIAGTQTVNRIARFNRNTNSWQSLGNGLSGNVNAMEIKDNFIYVGGTFTTASNTANENLIMNNIARWSAANGWEALGVNTDVGLDVRVNALQFTNNNSELFVGGNFTTAGNLSTNNIALWAPIFCSEDSIIPEYRINGTWTSGSNTLSVTQGDAVILSILPNTVNFTILLPNGTTVTNDFSLGNISISQAGVYTYTTQNGCSETLTITVNPDTDFDNDGVPNATDNCPNTPNGQTVDANGCSSSQLDDDNDGVFNNADNCPNTPAGINVDANGCPLSSTTDTDNDGVVDLDDDCPNTPNGETVDANGCASSQLDDDNDGVFNNADNCPNTPAGINVDANGCPLSSTTDTDNDGVVDLDDDCPNTPNGETVDANGCASSQLDDDNDGVFNNADNCPNTPAGINVDANGCPLSSTTDTDNDGVVDLDDDCPNTPNGETVDANGCASSQLDDDNDGVFNNADNCPNTPSGINVDANGCPVNNIPATFYTISSTGASCTGGTNGTITIGAQASGNYTATLTNEIFNESYPFLQSLTILDLPSGLYDLCIVSEEFDNSEFCSKVNITQPAALAVQIALNTNTNSVTLKMNGSAVYNIDINGKQIQTNENELSFTLLEKVNHIKVISDQLCQGIFEETIILENAIPIYPNPVDKLLHIDLSHLTSHWVEIALYTELGVLIKHSTHQTNEALLTIDTESLSSGLYILTLKNESLDKSFKIVKP